MEQGTTQTGHCTIETDDGPIYVEATVYIGRKSRDEFENDELVGYEATWDATGKPLSADECVRFVEPEAKWIIVEVTCG